jgi:cellulose biosynthesis protein BcsQ
MTAIAVLSLKGGVGKSTVVLGMAGTAWDRQTKALVVDLDPQANATSALDVIEPSYTIYDVLHDGNDGIAADAVVPSGWGNGIDVIAAEESLSRLAGAPDALPAHLLRTTLGTLPGQYDLVFFDCPPSLGALTRAALAAADAALIVAEPSYFGLQGAERALAFIDAVRDSANLGLRTAGVLLNRVRPSHTEHALRIRELRAAWPHLVLRPEIPERAAIQQAQGAAVPVQSWHSQSARDASHLFEAVLDEVLGSMNVPSHGGMK